MFRLCRYRGGMTGKWIQTGSTHARVVTLMLINFCRRSVIESMALRHSPSKYHWVRASDTWLASWSAVIKQCWQTATVWSPNIGGSDVVDDPAPSAATGRAEGPIGSASHSAIGEVEFNEPNVFTASDSDRVNICTRPCMRFSARTRRAVSGQEYCYIENQKDYSCVGYAKIKWDCICDSVDKQDNDVIRGPIFTDYAISLPGVCHENPNYSIQWESSKCQ